MADEGSIPETRMLSMLTILNDLKWCSDLCESFFLYCILSRITNFDDTILEVCYKSYLRILKINLINHIF